MSHLVQIRVSPEMETRSKMERETFQLRWNKYESNFSDAFLNLKEEKDFSDVTLVCGDCDFRILES